MNKIKTHYTIIAYIRHRLIVRQRHTKIVNCRSTRRNCPNKLINSFSGTPLTALLEVCQLEWLCSNISREKAIPTWSSVCQVAESIISVTKIKARDALLYLSNTLSLPCFQSKIVYGIRVWGTLQQDCFGLKEGCTYSKQRLLPGALLTFICTE